MCWRSPPPPRKWQLPQFSLPAWDTVTSWMTVMQGLTGADAQRVANDWREYWVDLSQRWVLYADTLRHNSFRRARGDRDVVGGAPRLEAIEDPDAVQARFLVLHGAADPHVPVEQVLGFQEEMHAADVDWYLIAYGGAVHSFTNPNSGNDLTQVQRFAILERLHLVVVKLNRIGLKVRMHDLNPNRFFRHTGQWQSYLQSMTPNDR